MRKYNYQLILLAAVLLAAGACKKDFTNPNAATEEETFNSDRAATAVATGIQRVYSTTAASPLYALINANGFVTNEIILRNPGNIPELQLSTGGNAVDGTNTVLANVWTKSNKIIYDANKVIAFAEGLDDKAYASGLISYVSIFKALSIGNMSMLWEQVPDTVGANVGFISRVDGFKKAIAVLDRAIALYNANPPSASVINRLPAEVNVINTLYALKARYSIYIDENQQALDAAEMVDLTKKSTLNFTAQNLNPVYESATSTNNVYQPIDSTLGLPPALPPDEADKRVPFYTAINTAVAPRFRINGFYANSTSPIPIYLPGEIMLIKAEAYARLNQLPEALEELNNVITKAPGEDPYGVGADLPAIQGPLTQDELLAEIYRNRSIELYLSGLKLEDMRRFNRPNDERKRNFFPYPFQERDNNPNTPDDPTF
jgi:starch-binding outer membrane protein, SusD/RagB family